MRNCVKSVKCNLQQDDVVFGKLWSFQSGQDQTDLTLDPKQHYDLWNTHSISAADWISTEQGR